VNKSLIAAGVLAVAAVGGWFGWQQLRERPAPVATQELPDEAPEQTGPIGDVETVSVARPEPVDAGTTPMAKRVAVLGLLNKRNGQARDVQLKPGGAIRIGDTVIRLRACERTAPWEPEQLTGAFVQLDVRGADAKWRHVFSGWLYKERPALNVVQHPVYDVWVKSCTTSFPERGPDTVTPGASEGSAPRSNARKSPASAPSAPSGEPSEPESAAPSNAR
jgi:hypothetical protein